MITKYDTLASRALKAGGTCLRPIQTLPERVKLSDPATHVMTDLSKVSVITVRAKTLMDKAKVKMIKYGVRMLLVLDDNEHLQHMGGTYTDIFVGDLMTPLRELEAMSIQDVNIAKVGNIVASLKKANRQHAMVMQESGNGQQTVCGLFSITQIARQLGAQPHNFELARTFAEIEAVIALG